MSQPPPFSDDRQWWWNGTEWRPVSEYHGSVPPSGPPAYGHPAPAQVAALPPKKRRRWLWGCGGVIALLVLLGICVSAINSAGGNKTSTSSPSPKATASTPSGTAQTTTAPKPQFITFHDGTQRVGQDVQPGTYRTRSGSSGCYFARLKGFSGQLADIAANGNTDGPAVVSIDSADKGFQSQRCSTWTSDLSAITKSQTSFGEGDFIVSTDIQPGTYRSDGGGNCYYARLNGWSHELKDIVANGNSTGPTVVTIAPGDKGFESNGCGTWNAG